MNIWVGVTMLVGFIVSGLAVYLGIKAMQSIRANRLLEGGADADEKIPMALLQQRSLWNILSMFVGIALMMWLFAGHPVSGFFENDSLRMSITAVLVVTLMANLFLMLPTSKKGKWSDAYDERDEIVLQRATSFQTFGLFGINVIWSLGLTEYYWDAGSIPIDIPYLMFWSNFLKQIDWNRIWLLVDRPLWELISY